MKASEIVFGNAWYGGTLSRRLNEGSECLHSAKLLFRRNHLQVAE